MPSSLCFVLLVLSLVFPRVAAAATALGYYRFPAIHGDTIVFTAEGDLWEVGAQGGAARRLTTPSGGGDRTRPSRRTARRSPSRPHTRARPRSTPCRIDGGAAGRAGPTRASGATGRRLDAGRQDLCTPPTLLDAARTRNCAPRSATRHADALIPLAQASDGVLRRHGKTLFFTRLPFQGSHTKRYQGGTAQNLWRFARRRRRGRAAHRRLRRHQQDADGWHGRVYFVSDRDGTMNLWSMDANGGDLRQHTQHRGWDVQSPVALATGASSTSSAPTLRLYDIARRQGRAVPDPPRLRFRPDARAVGQEADGLPHRGPPLAERRPRGADGARPGVRGAGCSRAGSSRRRGKRAACATATPASCRTARRCSRCPTRAARWNCGRCRPTASARPSS